jgi:TetR/AcrR family transcriptional repressor of mexCD-oprJ operon
LPDPSDAEPGGGGSRRRDALRNDAQIVAAATRLLADNPEATMQDVADAAGLGRATVYRHFPTREGLTRAIELAAIAEVGAALADGRLEEGDPVEALGRAIELIFEIGDRYRVVAHNPRAGHSDEKRDTAEGAFRPMAALLERARRQGALAPEPPLEWVYAVVGAIIGAAFRQLALGTLTREEAPRVVMRTILSGFGSGGAAA